MATQDNTVKVGEGGNRFVPPTLTVAAGTPVHWVVVGQAHTVTSNGNPDANVECTPHSAENFSSGEMDPGDPNTSTFDHTFNTTGSFSYHCEIHGCGMKGTINVI